MSIVREAAIAVFRAFGVDAIFGNPGSTELPMLRDLPSDIPYILELQDAQLFLVGDDPAHIAALPGGIGVVASPARTLARVAERIQRRPVRHLALERTPPAPAMTDAWLMHPIAALRPADSVVVGEARRSPSSSSTTAVTRRSARSAVTSAWTRSRAPTCRASTPWP